MMSPELKPLEKYDPKEMTPSQKKWWNKFWAEVFDTLDNLEADPLVEPLDV